MDLESHMVRKARMTSITSNLITLGQHGSRAPNVDRKEFLCEGCV
jgi:hypothetical protein